jgi:DNA-binding CsgD family transcriptional regulator
MSQWDNKKDEDGQEQALPSAEKPWLDSRGVPLPVNVLRELSATWLPKVWATYLDSIEVGLHEDLGVSKDRCLLLEEHGNREAPLDDSDELGHLERVVADDEMTAPLISESATLSEEEILQRIVDAAMQQLTANEHAVVRFLFWEGRSERDISSLLRRSRRTIRVWRDRAFEKLRALLSPSIRIGEELLVESSPKSRRSPSKPKSPKPLRSFAQSA